MAVWALQSIAWPFDIHARLSTLSTTVSLTSSSIVPETWEMLGLMESWLRPRLQAASASSCLGGKEGDESISGSCTAIALASMLEGFDHNLGRLILRHQRASEPQEDWQGLSPTQDPLTSPKFQWGCLATRKMSAAVSSHLTPRLSNMPNMPQHLALRAQLLGMGSTLLLALGSIHTSAFNIDAYGQLISGLNALWPGGSTDEVQLKLEAIRNASGSALVPRTTGMTGSLAEYDVLFASSRDFDQMYSILKSLWELAFSLPKARPDLTIAALLGGHLGSLFFATAGTVISPTTVFIRFLEHNSMPPPLRTVLNTSVSLCKTLSLIVAIAATSIQGEQAGGETGRPHDCNLRVLLSVGKLIITTRVIFAVMQIASGRQHPSTWQW